MGKKLLSKGRILESVRSAGIPKDELVVVGGAALQLFGIKKQAILTRWFRCRN